MTIATLYPDGVITATEVSGTLSDYTADDGTYGAATSGGATVLRLDYPTPAANPLTGAGAQTVEWDTQKVGGSNTPDFAVKVYAAGSLVATIASGQTAGVGSATFTFSGFAADGSDLSIEIEQTSGTNGNAAKKAYIETDYLRWVVDTEVPMIVEIIGVASMALSARAVTTKSDLVASVVAGSFGLTGRAVTAAIDVVDVVAKAVIALTGRAVAVVSSVTVTPAKTSFSLTGRAVLVAGPTSELIAGASMSLTSLVARLNVTTVIGAASTSVQGQAVIGRTDVVASILAGSTVLSTGDIKTSVDVVLQATVATMALSGQDLTTRLELLESIATAAINYFGGAVTTLPLEGTGSNLTRLLSLPGIYTFLWKELVREETIEKL